MPEKKITVYLADDHDIVAQGISNLLRSVNEIETVETFANGRLLYNACSRQLPELVILDLEMPEWDGITTLKKLSEFRNIPVIILSMNDEKTMIEECMKAGASAFLNKNCSPGELQEAVRMVLSGNIFLSE